MSPTINGASAEGSSIFEDDEYDDEGEANVPSGTTLVAEN
jgi:hypothetical protein